MCTSPSRRSFWILLAGLTAVGCRSGGSLVDPGPPATISVRGIPHGLRARFGAVEGASGYRVYLATHPGVGPSSNDLAVTTPGSEVDIAPLPDATQYYLVVTALAGNGETPASVEVSATTLRGRLSNAPVWSRYGDSDTSSFGFSLSTAGDVNDDGLQDVVVGSPGEQTAAGPAAGRVQVFLGSPQGLSTNPVYVLDGTSPGEKVGYSVSTAGDVQGTGYQDVLVGAPGAGNNTGTAFLLMGGPSGLTLSSWTPAGASAGSQFGFSVFTAKDPLGIGYDSVVIGAPYAAGGAGTVFAWAGGSNGLPTAATAVMTGTQPGEHLGWALAHAGDVNADGLDDILVGAPDWSGPLGASQGQATLFLGEPGKLLDPAQSVVLSGDRGGARFGSALAKAGNTYLASNFDDVIIGAPGETTSAGGQVFSSAGAAFLFRGGTGIGGPALSGPVWSYRGVETSSGVGATVSAGDVSGDGLPALMVSAYRASQGRGEALLFLSSSGTEVPDWVHQGDGPAEEFGYWLYGEKDFNGDGFKDLLVGSPYAASPTSNLGKVELYLGGPGYGPEVEVGAGLATAGPLPYRVRAYLARFSDLADRQLHRCTWDWGDSSPPQVIDPCAPADPAAVEHVYKGPGTYRIKLTVRAVDGRDGESAALVELP